MRTAGLAVVLLSVAVSRAAPRTRLPARAGARAALNVRGGGRKKVQSPAELATAHAVAKRSAVAEALGHASSALQHWVVAELLFVRHQVQEASTAVKDATIAGASASAAWARGTFVPGVKSGTLAAASGVANGARDAWSASERWTSKTLAPALAAAWLATRLLALSTMSAAALACTAAWLATRAWTLETFVPRVVEYARAYAASYRAKIVTVALLPALARAALASAGRGVAPAPWQLALAASWAANMIAVAVPGRYDGQAKGGKSGAKPPKLTALSANLFTPAGWAFAIWAPIFAGEALMMLLITSASAPVAPQLYALGRAVAPGWCAGIAAQVAWCWAFRPAVCGPTRLWAPAGLLGLGALGLGAAHSALRALALPPPAIGDALVRWPIVLHFGWLTAASLVNANNWLARRGTEVRVKAGVAAASVAAAVLAAALVVATTGDALYAFVVCWALAAVAADGGREARGVVDDKVLDRTRAIATGGAAVTAAGLLVKISQTC